MTDVYFHQPVTFAGPTSPDPVTQTLIIDNNYNATPPPELPIPPSINKPLPFIIECTRTVYINFPQPSTYDEVYIFTFKRLDSVNTLIVTMTIPVDNGNRNGYNVSYSVNQTALTSTITFDSIGRPTFTFIWTEGDSPFKGLYDIGDRYDLNLVLQGPLFSQFFPVFQRKSGITLTTPILQTIPNVTVRVPSINIQGQTTVNGDYLSDFTFIIKDKYKYYDYDCKILKNKKCHCEPIYIDQCKLKTTTFLIFNPEMQCVVKGKGKTLQDKLLYYYNKHPEIGPSFTQDFYEPMILYGMLKYILAKLLYGDFNINYLCRNFNKQFFKDLKHSRFCGFIEFFEDPANGIIDFDEYFIKCDC